ncbi:hypothetical protein [Motilibacter aurantiacus]|uniref:hypothetical protein n=1 Tax=Motilibacter aurantiacus TaxID=2714955 RepID=UPI00140A012E|nr:hypothetical protein [Motilibacter aurantiacus]NHC45201.1 hypothetical protein [Motilibacter aurantiacus]
MTVQTRDGVVRLAVEDWLRLIEEGDAALPAQLAQLPGVPEAVRAARRPLARVQLDVASPRVAVRHHAWAGDEAVAVLAHVRGAEHQLMPLPPPFLAGFLARLAGLRPHRVDGTREPRPVDEELLDDLFHPDDLRRSSAYAMLAARGAFALATAAPSGERRLAVVEDGRGLWAVEPEPGEEGWQLAPTTPTVLWRRMSAVGHDVRG